MRKIEKEMVAAIVNKTPFNKDNTTVVVNDDGIIDVLLYGKNIATIGVNGFINVNVYTLHCYPTNTTKSRLRALGVDVYTKKGFTYLNGELTNKLILQR